jgi:hypothetical protein
MTLPDGTFAIVTQSTSGNPNDPCVFCGRKPHAKLCDFPLRGKSIRRCSKRLCEHCATTLGVELDLCPVHAEIIESHQLAARLEPLLAQNDVRARDVACDLIESVAGIVPARPAFKPKDLADWKEFAGERAAIFEYEGGWPREVAERKALALAGERPKR